MQNMILLAKQLLVVYNITVLLGQTNEKAIIKQQNNYPPPPYFFIILGNNFFYSRGSDVNHRFRN